MSDFTLNAATRPKVTITTRDGEAVSDHVFEVLPLDKERYAFYMKYAKVALSLRARLEAHPDELPSDEDQEQAAEMMLSTIDARLRSTNGPVTIRGLWDDEKLGLEHLRALGDYLYGDLNPPA